jgi:hypothetical protein
MGKRTWIAAAGVLLASTALLSTAAHARGSISVQIGVPSVGYYAPGYSPGYYYAPPTYYAPPAYYAPPTYYYPQTHYAPVYVAPHYGGRRDRDGDGIPNRFDRRPNNPYRY